MYYKEARKNEDLSKEWRDGVYLATAENTMEADILESKLRGEGIPCVRRESGAGNYLEIFMGSNSVYPIDLYVPAETLETAKEVIVPVPILSDEFPEEPVNFDELSEEELTALIGEPEPEKKR